MSQSINSKRWRILLLSPLLLLLLLPWCRREGASRLTATDESEASHTSPIEQLVAKELGPPPYWVEVGDPLPGRPDVGLPIPKSVFKSVTLKFDGKPARKEPFRFKAGQTVKIQGEIEGQPQLPINVGFGGGVGVVSKSDNKAGWVIMDYRFAGAHTFQRHAEFELTYTFPNKPGEYFLVTLSDATVGLPPVHQQYMSAQFELILE